ncbi:MAG TPA: hypothetical protein VIG69_07230 [Candidatus Methylomirabilis sp.]
MTAQGVQPFVGRVAGGVPKGILISLNGEQQVLDVWGTKFEGEVALRPGANQIRAVAMGPRGILAEESVSVQYVPPAPSPDIRIVKPLDGTTLDGASPDVVTVEGEAIQPAGGMATLVFNGFTMPVPIRNGRFSTTVPVIATLLKIWAEMPGEGASRRSLPVTVRTEGAKPSRGYVLLYLPTSAAKFDARALLAHRSDPAEAHGPRKVITLSAAAGPGPENKVLLFPFQQTQPGAYTIALEYRLPPGEPVERGWGLIFAPGARGYRVLRLGPFPLGGKGRATLAKFLLPQAVFWEEDAWFNAFAEGSDSLTKFHYSDGVSWTEPKGE